MPDSSYITKLQEAQTLVASRFVPRIVSPPPIPNTFTLPNGFSILKTSDNTVDVNINGNLNVAENLSVNGGIDPIYLQLRPQSNTISPFSQNGTLWVQQYKDNINIDQFKLKLNNNTIYDTTNAHLKNSINNIKFETLKTNRIAVDFIDATTTNTSGNIEISANLIPPTGSNLSLGTENNKWDTVWANKLNAIDLTISPNTINVLDENGNKMSISYDVIKGASYITTGDVTVQAVTTSKYIPGQIDPSLLPFSGLNFASKINITEYRNNVGNSLYNQLLHSIYTLNKEVITSPFYEPNYNVEHNINKIIGQLNGNYYVVINSNKQTEQVLLPRIKANTDFNIRNTSSSVNITSKFSIISEELVDITDGDILVIYYSYVPNGEDFDIIFGIQIINFRLPINSVINNNIVDNTITSAKLKDQTITNSKLAPASISLRNLSDEVINYITSNTRDNNQISTITCLCNNLENKVGILDRFIRILSETYYIKDTVTDTILTLDNINDIDI